MKCKLNIDVPTPDDMFNMTGLYRIICCLYIFSSFTTGMCE